MIRSFLRPRRFLAIAVLASVAAFLAYAVAVMTPEVGVPHVVDGARGEPLWTFGFVGDTQQAGPRLDPLMAALEKRNVEFVLHLGDMVDEAASDPEWNELLAAAAKHRVRLMPVVGNHDVRRDYADDGSIRFRQFFPDLPNTFYHFRHRGVNFLMLNSERSFLPGGEQAKFIDWHLKWNEGPTIACLHRPTFTASNRDPASMYSRRVWLHGAIKNTAVVGVLSGHNHYYERTKPLDGVTYVVSGGGGGVLREPHEANEQTAALVTKENHYGLCRVYDDHIAVEVRTLDDRKLDEFTLPLAAAAHKPGTFENKYSLELPPLTELPEHSIARRR